MSATATQLAALKQRHDALAADAPSLSPAERRIEELGRIILIYSEITERLEQSHQRLQETVQHLRQELSEKSRLLERKKRLAALGEMAAGMAHEIRNPLGGIQLYASLLQKDLCERPESLSLVQKISGGVRRLEALVSQVLQFTREITAHPAPTDLADLVDQAIELAGPTIRSRGIETSVCGPRPFVVRIDPTLIGQALLNLVLNAAEAMDQAGRLIVSYGAPDGPSAGGQFFLFVQDTGPGIPPKLMDQIFNPFFTTKDGGTGLGLAIVHRIVEAHDGSITATNVDAGGARFEVRI